MNKHTPYTYLIGWPHLNKWYYGVRYSKNCHPTDLWVSYKTSSKLVEKFVAEHGDPPFVEVRRTFVSVKKAQAWEEKVLKKLKVAKSLKWINGHDSRAFDPSTVPRGNDHWTKQNTEAALKWKNREGWAKKNSQDYRMPSGNNHWTAKDTNAALQHQIRMNGAENPNNLPGVKEKKSEYLKKHNPVFKEEVRDKIRKSLLGKLRPRKICEHCKKDIADSIYTKFHGEKCKHKLP